MAHHSTSKSDRDLLSRITRSAGSKAGYKQLVRELGLGGGRKRRELLEQLARLVGRGDLVQTNEEMWTIPKSEPDIAAVKREPLSRSRFDGMEAQIRSGRDRLVSGRLDLHRDGFGFVRPDAPTSGGRGAEDIFIPPNEINGAMQGDLVLVDEAAPGRDGRRSGRIARILTRRNPTVVGIFRYAQWSRQKGRGERESTLTGNYVTPLDERVASLIEIPDGAEVVATGAESPHRTLGDEARAPQVAWMLRL